MGDPNGDEVNDVVVGVLGLDGIELSSGVAQIYDAPIPLARAYFSSALPSSIELLWLPDNNEISSPEGSLHSAGASPIATGVFGVSYS
ncbi:MAG: hypothetical protein ACI97A_003197 [Planctomycetota bacterium]|jgi:hypothetical protein